MKSKIETVKSFVIEMIVILLPLAIAFLFLGLWLSGVTHNYQGVDAHMFGNVLVEFQYLYQGEDYGLTTYNFGVIQVFWITSVLTITLILIGKIVYLLFAKSIIKVKASKVMSESEEKQVGRSRDDGKDFSTNSI